MSRVTTWFLIFLAMIPQGIYSLFQNRETVQTTQAAQESVEIYLPLIFNNFLVSSLSTPEAALAELEQYQAETGWDAHSPTPQDPLFFGENNYHLSTNSPAKGAGIFLENVSQDRDGYPRSSQPSLGVYE